MKKKKKYKIKIRFTKKQFLWKHEIWNESSFALDILRLENYLDNFS